MELASPVITKLSSVIPPEGPAWGSSCATLFRNLSTVVRLACSFFHHGFTCKQIMHHEILSVLESMFSKFLRSLWRSAKGSANHFTVNFFRGSFSFSFPVVSFSLGSSSAMQFQQFLISHFLRNHFWKLLSVMVTHTQWWLFAIPITALSISATFSSSANPLKSWMNPLSVPFKCHSYSPWWHHPKSKRDYWFCNPSRIALEFFWISSSAAAARAWARVLLR